MTAQQQLEAQGFKTFLPIFWKTTRHARQFRTAKAPLFPGYLFVELLIGRDPWRSVNGTIGVVHVVMGRDGPIAVPPGVVEDLQGLSDDAGLLSFQERLAVGQRARLMSGPLAGYVGELTKMPSARRVEVLLEIMGSSVSVTASRDTLAPVA